MNQETKDRAECIQCKTHEAKGAVKEKTGAVIGNETLNVEGKAERAEGKTQGVVSKAENKIEDATHATNSKSNSTGMNRNK